MTASATAPPRHPLAARGLYALVDTDALAARGIDPTAFAAAVLQARPAALQLRAKGLGARDALALLRSIAPLARSAGVPFFANDRPDLALLAGCDGVHVGQDDVPLGDVRAFAPSLRVGVSTHDLAQLARALDDAPDYVAFGPVFATSSKARPDPVVGLDGLAAARALVAARAPLTPLVAIGGIDLDRAPSVRDRGAIGAVIGALFPSETPPAPTDVLAQIAARASALSVALGGP